MRTVSFSSETNQQLMNEKFVCSYHNSKGEANTGASFAHAPDDDPGLCTRGNGKLNVQLFFFTPNGNLFHILTGYVGAEPLQEELEFAYSTYEAMAKRRSRAKSTLLAAHREFLKKQGYSEGEIKAKDPFRALGPVTIPSLNLPKGLLPNGNRAQGANVERIRSGGGRERGRSGETIKGIGAAAQKLLDGQVKQQTLRDHRFAMDYPLLPAKKFNPRLLGFGMPFFGSTGFGSPPSGSLIGLDGINR